MLLSLRAVLVPFHLDLYQQAPHPCSHRLQLAGQSTQALDSLRRHSLPKVKVVARPLCSQRWLLRQLNHHA